MRSRRSNLAEARTEQAFRLYWFDFDWPGAEREFRARARDQSQHRDGSTSAWRVCY
jgi:hypothetical protein